MKKLLVGVLVLGSISVFAAEKSATNFKVSCKGQWVYDQIEKSGSTEALIQTLISNNSEAGFSKVIAVNSNMVGNSNVANVCVTSEK